MNNRSWKEAFYFTKQERFGIIALLLLMPLSALLPLWWPGDEEKLDPREQELFAREAARLDSMQAGASGRSRTIATARFDRNDKNRATGEPAVDRSLFYFDPNTLDDAGWKRLGLRDRTILTIRHFLEKGGRFRRPADLGRIYGWKEKDWRPLLPYVRIQKETGSPAGRFSSASRLRKTGVSPEEPAGLDINRADSMQWEALPGIGPVLTRRILLFRKKLGGFCSVDQVGETYGLPDSVFRKLRPLFQLSMDSWKTFDLNRAGQEELANHPYIHRNLARILVRYRQEHGPFQSPRDLLKIDAISPELFEKIKPYIRIQPE